MVGAVLALVVTTAGAFPAAALPAAASAAGVRAAAAGSAELDARAGALQLQLAEVEADQAATVRALDDLARRIGADQDGAFAAAEAEDEARRQLGRYAVSAYVRGDVEDIDFAVTRFTDTSGEVATAGRRVLAVTAHAALVGDVRRAAGERDRLDADLLEARGLEADARAHITDLEARHTGLTADLAATQAAAVQARAAEARAAAEQARREAEARQRAAEDQLRANTPRPQAVHSGVVPPRTVAVADAALLADEIPFTPLDAYWRAAAFVGTTRPGCGIDWGLLAGIGKVETNHGRFGGSVVAADGSTDPTILGIPLDGRNGTARIPDSDGGALDGDPVADRAVGPMQFIPTTWRAYAGDGNGDGVADPHNVYDAAVAAANYLCATGGGSLTVLANQSHAVYAYNRSAAYNIDVLTRADHYRRILDPSLPAVSVPAVPPAAPNDLPPPASPEHPPSTPVDPSASSTTTTTSTPGGNGAGPVPGPGSGPQVN